MTASRTNSLTVAAMLLFAASGCSKKPAPENQTAAPSPAPVLPDEHTLKDTDITAATEASLARDPGVHANDVHVKTTDGIVELTGKAKDLLTKQRATMLAEGVKGVRAVSNRIELDVKNVPDAEIENSVRDTLLYNPVTKSFEVDVKANNGIVTLTGSVHSGQEKQLSGMLAESVKGVHEVKNNLQIQYSAARSDAEIKRDVESHYRRDRLLNDGLIGVAVKDGAVTLKGIVGSAAERRRAEMSAWVNGTKSVDDSGLAVQWWAKDEDLRRNKFVPKSDPEIAQAIRDAVALDPRVQLASLNVSVAASIVTLSGIVHSPNAKAAAEGLARNTTGVTDVRNNLNVVPEKPVPDDLLKRRVQNAYLYDPLTNAYQIDVKADHGVVTLAGKVDNAFERAEAMQLAARMDGVKRVNNQLDVKHPEIPYVYNWYVAPYEPIVELWYYAPSTTIQTDADIRKHIETELTWSPFVNEQQVHVDVVGGKATLTGTVDSTAERVAAVGDAFEGGAITVDDRLKVKAPGS